MPRSPTNNILEALQGKRDELRVSLHILEQAQSSEDAFELPGGPEAEINHLRSELIAIEEAIKKQKSSASRS